MLLILINYLYDNKVSVVIRKQLSEKQVFHQMLVRAAEGFNNSSKPERGAEQISVCEKEIIWRIIILKLKPL